MAGKFTLGSEVHLEPLDWGRLGWLCSPASVGAKQLAIVEATFLPGKGHSFHKHPNQEEVIFVVSGTIEQWIDKEKRVLSAGDSVFVPPGMVHGSFTVGNAEAKILAIFGPCRGDGFETIDVFNEAPWNSVRT